MSPYGWVSWEFAVSTQSGDQISPALAHGLSDTLFVTYAGFTDSINGHAANTMRIWGKFYKYISVEETKGIMPEARSLLLVYPNSFSEKINMRCTVQDSRFGIENSSLKIYDVGGKLVRNLTNDLASNTMNHVSVISWEGNDNSGYKLPGGVYFIRFEADGYKQVEKVILFR